MRIAGINSPNYHLNQANKPQQKPSHGQTSVDEQSSLPQPAVTKAQESLKPVSQQHGALMHTSAKNDTRDTGESDDRVRFYSRNEALEAGMWNAYTSAGAAPGSPIPDNTSHKAREAISQYLQTQFIEERLHFEAVLGVDDYA
ncbi:hypothetical protein [Kaarinaea lacus]